MTRPGRRPPDARRTAYNILHDVGSEGAYANLAVDHALRDGDLDARDAAFATDLVYGVLRNRTVIDAALTPAVDRALNRLDPRLLDVLRLGAYQWLFAGTPPHATVTTTVDLARSVAGEGPAKVANAVLRRVVRRPGDEWIGDVTDLGVRWSHPQWIISAYRDALGPDSADELPALLAANNTPPPVTLAARPGLADATELLAAGARRGSWSELAFRAPPGHLRKVAAVREGRAAVQDEGSQLTALALAAAPLAGEDRVWLDMCAGPGGKAALLAAIAAQRGARVVALDRREHRARLVAGALREPSNVGIAIVADGREPPVRDADRVLVDAPCTGLGVIRRRPDLRWRRTPRDVAVLADLQRALLTAGIRAARPGGLIAYVTCSPHIAETDLIIGRCVDPAEVELIDAREWMADVPDLGPGPFARLWPHRHDTDGMFLALMRKRT